MAISKVILNGDTLMDVTSDTVEAGKLLSGETATKNDGTKVTGTLVAGTPYTATISSETGGNSNNCYVLHNGVKYYTDGQTFTFYAGDAITLYAKSDDSDGGAQIVFGSGVYSESSSSTECSYSYEAIGCNIGFYLEYDNYWSEIEATFLPSELVLDYTKTNEHVIPSQSTQLIQPAGSTYGLGGVIVDAMPSGSATPASSVSANGATVTTGTNTLTLSKSVSNTPQVTAGYVSAGTAGNTNVSLTANVTTKAAATITPSTTAQTIASETYLTGTQTIEGDSNLIAANIAEGVPIFGVTGTHSGATSYTATIYGSGSSNYCYVTHNGTKYYTDGNTFTFKSGDTLTVYCRGNYFELNGEQISLTNYSYTYTLPIGDVNIAINYDSSTSNDIGIWTYVAPTGVITISSACYKNVYSYAGAAVAAGSAFPPAVTITKAPTFSMNSSTGVITASYTGSSSITPTVNAGYVTAGTAGIISTTGTSTYALTTQGAQTITPGSTTQIIASNRWLTGTQTIAGDSNLVADNIAEGVSIFGVIGTHSGGGNGFTTDQIAMKRISGTISGSASFIEAYAFYGFSSLNVAIFSNATYVNNYAFCSCYRLTEVDFPLASFIGNSAFYGCSLLSEANFPSVTSIGSYAFASCSRLTTVNFPVASQISNYAFYNCSWLSEINFPSVTSIGNYAFYNCSRLTTVNFPLASRIGSSAFDNCINLSVARFSALTYIYYSAFYGCTKLLSLYLLGSSVPTLANSTVFSRTPIAGYTSYTSDVYGSIFVPASLYDSYLTATWWSVYSARIVSV